MMRNGVPLPPGPAAGPPGGAAPEAGPPEDDWLTPGLRDLLEAVLGLGSLDQAERFFRDLCTVPELRSLAVRWEVARMLDEGVHYQEIARRTGASTATVTRVNSWLRHGRGGYRRALDRRRPG